MNLLHALLRLKMICRYGLCKSKYTRILICPLYIICYERRRVFTDSETTLHIFEDKWRLFWAGPTKTLSDPGVKKEFVELHL